jgi:polyhydroxyalkanoate synthesis regulator phasin
VPSRTGTEPEAESPEKTHETGENNIALSEDEEMKIPGTNIVEELTQQFALIDPKNSSDLEAVGEALIQIPSGLGSVSGNFESFRHEVLTSILRTAREDGLLEERLEVLSQCINIFAADTEQGDSALDLMRITDLILTELADGIDEAIDRDVEFGSQRENLDDRPLDQYPEPERSRCFSRPSRVDGLNSVSGFSLAEGEVGSTTHAETLIAEVMKARDLIVNEEGSLEQDAITSPIHTSKFVEALKNANKSFLSSLTDLYDEELSTLSQYKRVCEDIAGINDRIDESVRCIRFIESGIRGETISDDLSDSNNHWLVSLVKELQGINSQQTAVSLEKGESIKGQLSEIQAEVDALQDNIKSIGSMTLEPPTPVMQSLMEDNPEKTEESPIDYEDSIDRYIDWMQEQRTQIREEKERLEILEQDMIQIERSADAQYESKLEHLIKRKSEVSHNLGEALKSAHKDADEAQSTLTSLENDALALISAIEKIGSDREVFSANIEEIMAGTMIRIGRIIDEVESLVKDDDLTDEEPTY